MSSRILILSASVGAGHLRAAEAVELALRETVPTAYVENLDVLQLTNAAFRRFYSKSQHGLAERAPHLAGYLYDLLDRTSESSKDRGDGLRLTLQKVNLRKLIRHLQRHTWDLIINTHFLPAEIVAWLRRRGRLLVPQVTVVTDFETHRLWLNQPCDHYFTASKESSVYLRHWGVRADDITLTGIPIHPVFCVPKERRALRKKYDLDEEGAVVLQLAGGFGSGPLESVYRALLEVPMPIQAVVVTGRNEKAKANLERVAVPERHREKIIGFTKDMDEWLRLADLIVSKPGGLTTSETLAAGAGMVIINPMPGQEMRNSDFLLENGVAVKANAACVLTHKVTCLLRDPERLAQLRANAARLARPRAAYDIVKEALEYLGKPVPPVARR